MNKWSGHAKVELELIMPLAPAANGRTDGSEKRTSSKVFQISYGTTRADELFRITKECRETEMIDADS